MNKDVIYIDTEDDVTAIIGKIKNSKEKIVALVPPKRIGVLQSAVNLRLLARMAENSDKRLVLVTNNKALINLSSVAKIPVARNLQSKPEMAEIAALEIDDGEDVIEGKQLPIGELMKTADSNENAKVIDVIDTLDVEKDSSQVEPNNFKKSGVKVPNFSRFRKRLFVGILLLIGLVGFLVWAIIYAPAAKVIITAKTSPESATRTVKLGGTAATDVSKGIIQTVSKQIIKDVSVDFTATGTKDLSEKATGTITIRNCDFPGFTLPIDSTFTVSGLVYISTARVDVPTFTGSSSACNLSSDASGKATVAVRASLSGVAYNNFGVSYSIDSLPSGSKVDAVGSVMAGGTTKTTTVVIADDVQKASQALVDLSSESVRQQLVKQFTNGESIIADSFNIVHAAAVSLPAIGAEATSKATLTSSTTFSITGIAKTELEIYLKDEITKKIADKNQRIYEDGIEKVVVSEFLSTDQGSTVKIFTDAALVGPSIDQAQIKDQVKGKQFGDAQAILSAIPGVDTVDIQFSYFWVKTIPTDVEKIDVQFTLQNA